MMGEAALAHIGTLYDFAVARRRLGSIYQEALEG